MNNDILFRNFVEHGQFSCLLRTLRLGEDWAEVQRGITRMQGPPVVLGNGTNLVGNRLYPYTIAHDHLHYLFVFPSFLPEISTLTNHNRTPE